MLLFYFTFASTSLLELPAHSETLSTWSCVPRVKLSGMMLTTPKRERCTSRGAQIACFWEDSTRNVRGLVAPLWGTSGGPSAQPHHTLPEMPYVGAPGGDLGGPRVGDPSAGLRE